MGFPAKLILAAYRAHPSLDAQNERTAWLVDNSGSGAQ
jgi:hypothetical protein